MSTVGNAVSRPQCYTFCIRVGNHLKWVSSEWVNQPDKANIGDNITFNSFFYHYKLHNQLGIEQDAVVEVHSIQGRVKKAEEQEKKVMGISLKNLPSVPIQPDSPTQTSGFSTEPSTPRSLSYCLRSSSSNSSPGKKSH